MKAFLALCFVLAISSSAAINVNFLRFDSSVVYDLSGFNNVVTTLKNLSFSNDVQSPDHNVTLNVSVTRSVLGCDGKSKVYATLRTGEDDSEVCHELATAGPNSASLLDSQNQGSGVILSFPFNSGTVDNTTNTTVNGTWANSTLEYRFICDSGAIFRSNFQGAFVDGGMVVVNVTSSNSCPDRTLSMLSHFFEQYNIVFLVIFIIIGVFITFFGLQMLKYTIFTIGAVGGTLVSCLILMSFLTLNSATWLFWLIFAVSVLIGCVVGYIAVKVETLGFIILGAILGVASGFIFYGAVLAPAGVNTLGYWITIVVFGIVGALIAFKFWKNIVIIATAILGAFMIMWSIGTATNTLPSGDAIANGVADFSALVYAYLAGILVLSILGMYFQHKKKKALDLENDEAADVHGYQRVMAYNP